MNTPRRWPIVLAVIVLCLWVCVLSSHADTGETCSDPIQVPWIVQWEYYGDLAPYANDYDPGVPGPSCTGSPAPGKDVAFKLRLHCAERLFVRMHPWDFDGSLYMVADCADSMGTCVTGSDEAGVGVSESIMMAVTSTRTYYVIVDAHEGNSGGSFDIIFERMPFDFPTGACCYADGECEVLEVAECEANGGVSQGPCTTCEPNPCVSVPTPDDTWGSIKARYR